MKKMMMMVAVALITAMNVNAQNKDLKNEISLSYGFGSLSQLGDGIGEGLVMAFFGARTEYDNGSKFGPLSLEYYRHLGNPRLAVGGLVSYSKWDNNILKNDDTHEKVGEKKRNYFAVMPAVKWYWINTNSIGLYTKAAAGVGFLSNKDKDVAGKSKSENSTHFMFQASLLGFEAGGKLRGFAEAGFGDQGFLQAGIRYKF